MPVGMAAGLLAAAVCAGAGFFGLYRADRLYSRDRQQFRITNKWVVLALCGWVYAITSVIAGSFSLPNAWFQVVTALAVPAIYAVIIGGMIWFKHRYPEVVAVTATTGRS